MDYLDHLENSTQHLVDLLEPGGHSLIGVRPGYDERPRSLELRHTIDYAWNRFPPKHHDEKLGLLNDFVEENFEEDVYVDWVHDGEWTQDLEKEDVTTFGYERRDSLTIELYEEGENLEKQPELIYW